MTWFKAIVEKHARVAVAGGPRTGKTTLANSVPAVCRNIYHGDSFIEEGWSGNSERLATVVNDDKAAVLVEGVQVPRALRKGMRVDCVVWLSIPHVPLTKKQEAMAKGCETVMNEWLAGREMTPIEGVPGASVLVLK